MEKEKQKDMTQDMSAEEKTEKKDGITEEAEEQCSCRKEESEAGGRNEKDDFCSCKKDSASASCEECSNTDAEETEDAEETAGENCGACEKKGEQEENEDESERYMRLMAEFQNYKRRSDKERNDIYSYANEKIIGELLEVADNFERALSSAGGNDGFIKGMEMIFDQLKSVMAKAGTEEIEALGMDFDPNFHNAVMTEDSSDYESGKITAVFQKGYMLNGKVIRPSMVKVAN